MTDTPARLLTLLSLLQTPREWPGSELASRLGVTARTVRRDVDRLRDLGYPVEASLGAAGGYRLVAGAALPPLLLEDDEAVAIAVGLRAAAGSAVAGIEEASVRALGKLEQVLPGRLRYRVRALGAATLPVGGGPVVDPEVLTALAAAIANREKVRFHYTSGDGMESGRLAEPLALVPSGRRWYLVAWDVDRSAGQSPPGWEGPPTLRAGTDNHGRPGDGGDRAGGDLNKAAAQTPLGSELGRSADRAAEQTPAGSETGRSAGGSLPAGGAGRSAGQSPPGWEGPPTLRAGADNLRRDQRDQGNDGDRSGWRTFRVDRITRVQPTGVRVREQRVLPADDAAAYVAGRRTDWGTPELHVVVSFEAPVSAVAGRLGDEPGQVVAIDETSCRLDARRDDSIEWLAARLVMLGCAFTVHEPAALRAAVAALGERAAAAVSGTGRSPGGRAG